MFAVKDECRHLGLRQKIRHVSKNFGGLAPAHDVHELPWPGRSRKWCMEFFYDGIAILCIAEGTAHCNLPEDRLDQRREYFAYDRLPQRFKQMIRLQLR